MGCLYQRKMQNKKYTANKKNGGIIPEMRDLRTGTIEIPCGNCWQCKKAKANAYRIRLYEELRHNEKIKLKGNYVTFTFNEKNLIRLNEEVKEKVNELIIKQSDIKYNTENQLKKLKGYNADNEAVTIAVKKWRETIRLKYRYRKQNEKFRYWAITELGQNSTERIHMHGIIWTNNIEEIQKIWEKDNGKMIIGDGHGANYVNDQSINYMIKYVTKTDKKHKNYRARIYNSVGLGKQYTERADAKLNEYKGRETNTNYTTKQGHKMQLLKYYKEKIIPNDEERENLWIWAMDEEKKYIDGVEVDVSTEQGKKNYKKVLEEARKKGKRLGHGDNKKDKELQKYENAKRDELRLERIQKEWSKNNKKAS